MSDYVMYCATCRGDSVFEPPPCVDDHDDCPELVCLGCGTAILMAPIIVWSLSPQAGGEGQRGGPATRIAPHQRRAA